MRNLLVPSSLAFLIVGLAACGKKDVPPAPATQAAPTAAPATTPVAADAGPSGTTTAPSEVDAGAAAGPVDTAAPVAVTSDDLLVWTETAGARQTVWIHGDEVAATRAEAVTVAAGKLWALGERWRILKEYPCKEGDDGFEGDRTKTPRQVVVPTLVAKELGGAGEVAVNNGFSEAETDWDGDVTGASVQLEGAIGAKIFTSGGSGFYACGAAHPYSDNDASVVDLVTKAAVAVEAPDALKQKAAAALKAEGKANDCFEEGAVVEPVAPDTLVLAFADGKATASWLVLREAEATWMHVCDLEVKVAAPPDATLGFGPFDARIEKVLATQKGAGTFGFATVPADRREALLELFRKEAPTFAAKPEVAEVPAAAIDGTAGALVNEGRKLTRAKDYAGAIAAFDAGLTKDPASAPGHSGRGYAKMLAGDAAGAKADFEKALTLETKDAGFQAAVWFNLGQLAEKGKDLAAAKAAYEKAIGFKPSEGATKALARVSK